jgi:hypothetical protein
MMVVCMREVDITAKRQKRGIKRVSKSGSNGGGKVAKKAEARVFMHTDGIAIVGVGELSDRTDVTFFESLVEAPASDTSVDRLERRR